MATRLVTGSLRRANGAPWVGVPVRFATVTSTYSASATHPIDERIVMTMGPDGGFSVELEAGLATAWQYVLPDGQKVSFVLPDGEASVSIEELRALGGFPVPATSAAAIAIAAAVDPVAASLEALSADVAGQLGQHHIAIADGEALTLLLLILDLDGTAGDLTGYACTFTIWANGESGGTPVIVLTEGDGVTTGAGVLEGETYNVLIEMDAATVTALPAIGLGTYALVGDNGVDWPRTLASYTVEVV